MGKRKRPLAYMWAGWLGVLLCVLTGCGTQTSSLPTTPTPDASAQMQTTTALAQVTADILFNVVGTYAGTYQWHGSSSSSPMRLEITRQEMDTFFGDYLLNNQRLPLLDATTTIAYGGEEGGISFTVAVPSSQIQQTMALNFRGVMTKEGSMTGDVSTNGGKEGTWSVKKV
jgi:hypothetical protein